MSLTQRAKQWAVFTRTWHIFDCSFQNPFDSAKEVAKYLKGLHKPIYHPLNDCGDHVVCINTREIALPEDEWIKRAYFHHTGYPGGATWTLAHELHVKDPTMVMRKSVYRAVGNNLARRHTMQRLHLYADTTVPEDIMKNVSSQIRQLRPVPERLDHISEEVRKAFPKIMRHPDNFLPKKDLA